MNARKSPVVTRIAINNALADGSVELASFYQYANTQIPEVALTEFAARLCYNSTAKLGNSPNFVRDVLSHGHLSVAEHASIAVIGSRFDVTFQKLIGVNRFFSRDRFYVAGNMRSWIEYLAVTGYSPISEVIISCFPPAFKVSEIIKEFDPEIFTFDNGFTVPGFENVDLLAVNFGNMPIINRVERRGENSWGRFTFLLSDISRACSHQIARHRGASISEQSQRYVDAEKRVGFTMPKNCTPEQEALMSAHYEQCMAYYRALRSSGMKKEDARFVLPMATNTRMVVSFDKNELVHFLGVRCAPDAQWEIRHIAQKMAVQAFLATGNESLEAIVDKYNLMNQI